MIEVSLFSRLLLEDNDDGSYTLLAPLSYRSERLGDVIVPKGFVTDFMSIPQVFTNLIPRDGKYGRAGVVHDWLYSEGLEPRATCDAVLLEALEKLGAGLVLRQTIYRAVRTFGQSHYVAKAGTA